MNLIKYINYRRLFIAIYTINVVIISSVVYLDPTYKISTSSIQYYMLISLFIFMTFMVYDYQRISRQVRNIRTLIERDDIIATLELLEKDDYLKREYYLLFQHLHNTYDSDLRKLITEKKDFEDFLSSWVHAIKTPITGLRLKQEADIFLDDKIGKELDAIDYYVEQSLFYNRLGAFSNDYIIQEIPLKSTCHKAVKKFSRIFINKKIAIHLDVSDTLVLSDEKWLIFILSQVLSNALKYTAPQGSISILSDGQQLKIIDTGMGIPHEELYRVFDKGFTGSNGRIEEQSTGMGLYLVKRMADALGHQIAIESTLKKGTTFTISFHETSDFHNITKV